MSSQKYATPLHIQIKASRNLFYILSLIYTGGFILLLMFKADQWWQLPLQLLLILALFFSAWIQFTSLGFIKNYLWICQYLPKKIPLTELLWHEDNQWFLVLISQHKLKAQLLASSYIHPQCIVLNFKVWASDSTASYRRSVVLLRDSASAIEFRHLRVRLALEGVSVPDNVVVPE